MWYPSHGPEFGELELCLSSVLCLFCLADVVAKKGRGAYIYIYMYFYIYIYILT